MVEPRSKVFIRLTLVITIGLVALSMRLYFANRHVIDHDEPTYLNAALRYTNYLRSGEYTWLAWDQYNYQHPVLSKILYGIVLLTQDPLVEMHDKNFDTGMPIQSAEGRGWGLAGRYTSAALGALASLAVATVNPLAGLFFATQSLNVISTSVVGLEALPLLTSFLAGIFYLSWVKQTSSQAPGRYASMWLGLSAVALGMTAASKYTYCVVGLAIAIHFILTSASQPRLRKYYPHMVAWTGLALIAFFIFDPYLWPHPVERLRRSLLFHASYSQSSNVTEEKLPFWQPLFWLGMPYYRIYETYRHQLLLTPDSLIALLALIGLPGLWKRERFYFIWLVTGLVLLLAWPTKWPQYTLIIMAPLCISAAQGALTIFSWLKDFSHRRM